MGPARSSPFHQREFGFVPLYSKMVRALNQVCLEFAGSSETPPIKPEEEQPIDWERQSVSAGSHVFGSLEQPQPCFAF